MKEIFYEIINESSKGKVHLLNDDFSIGFNTIIYENGQEKESFFNDNNMSTLVIKNEELFFKKLEEYLSIELSKNRKIPNYYNQTEKDRIKWILTYLFVYATPEDFINPIEYIDKKISFSSDSTFDDLKEGIEIPLGKSFLNTSLIIREENPPVSMETSHRIALEIKEDNSSKKYFLPSIYYDIREEKGEKICYLYGILKKDKRKDLTPEEEKFISRINRLLYKVDEGISKESDYSLDDEANIKDVSVSFVFALNIFLSLLQTKKVSKIKAVTYLPVPYLARKLTAEEISDEEKRFSFEERNDNIQTNLTNKFIRTLRRLCAQNKSLEVVTYPYVYDEFLTLTISSDKKAINNSLLEETDLRVRSRLGK